LTLLRLADDVIMANVTRRICHLDGGNTVLGARADRAVPISREGSLVGQIAGLDQEGGTVVEVLFSQVAPAWMPPLGPSPEISTAPPILKLNPEV
jgi:hypothetical protein